MSSDIKTAEYKQFYTAAEKDLTEVFCVAFVCQICSLTAAFSLKVTKRQARDRGIY